MMKFVRGNGGKVAPFGISLKGHEALLAGDGAAVRKDSNFSLSDGSSTVETELSLSSGSVGSIEEDAREEEEEEQEQKEQQQEVVQEEKVTLQKSSHLQRNAEESGETGGLVNVPEEEPLLAPPPPPSAKDAPPTKTPSVAVAPPPRHSALPPRTRHRRTSSAMPRLETLYEGRATVPSTKPPLPPTLRVAKSGAASLSTLRSSVPSSGVDPSARQRARSMSVSNLPSYPAAPAETPRPQRLHRRTYSAPPKQPQDLFSVTSLQQQLKQLQQQYGEEHAMVATTWNWLGNAHFRVGNMESALEAYKKAVLCEPGEHLADAYANMGTVHWATGNVEEAIPLLRNALSVHEYNVMSRGQDPNASLPVAAVQYQLGLALTLHKDYEPALHSLNQARAIRERVLGRNHMDVARTLDAMGKAHFLQGSFLPALECHLQAMEIKEILPLDATRSSIGTTMTNIVSVYRAMNNLPEAGALMHRLLASQKKEFLAHKTKALCADIGVSLTTLGEIYESASQLKEAASCFREADIYLGKARVSEEDPRRVRLRDYLTV